ncbi:Bud13 [Moelleriella libera RCEF 2490]|uniref:Bud13 n=1 Tax=Moelleriella libera RCEF 2490 TaxID=1081109 RepID=A0A166VGK9_9HYPO|nr:Bud13 [Moelleriella libera RCEF 2490]
MSADLSAYLASRYLVADPRSTSKKRKRKAKTTDGLVITEDDAPMCSPSKATEYNDDSPLAVVGATSDVRGFLKKSWKRIGSKDAEETEITAAADSILASAALENEARRAADSAGPVVEASDTVVKMSDGSHAGLQTAAAVSAQLKRRLREERDQFEHYRKSANEEETVYRDATGRRIDIAMKRAHARKAAAEAEDEDLLSKQALMGKVQKDELRKENEQLEEAKLIPFARTVDDESLNRDLMQQKRWNDPMLHFMTDSKADLKSGKKSMTRPKYSGRAPPNRYDIKPGYRWDGIDRSVGYEEDRTKAMARHGKMTEHSWQLDA